MSTHVPEDRSKVESGRSDWDPFANFRFVTAVSAIPLAVVLNLIPVGMLTVQALTAPEGKDYEYGLLAMLWLATPFFVTALVSALLQFRTRDRQRSRVLHRWTLGGLVVGILIGYIGIRL
jgi:hypothetical protein